MTTIIVRQAPYESVLEFGVEETIIDTFDARVIVRNSPCRVIVTQAETDVEVY